MVTKDMGKGYETMIFHGRKDGEIADYNELYERKYASERGAEVGHDQVVKDAERIISGLKH